MLKMNRSGVATRARILDSAIQVLAEDGFSGFTLQAVAKRAGIRYGNLTHHYPTRDVLVEAMYESLIERYRTQFQDLVSKARDRQASVRDMVTWLLDDSVSESTAPLFLQLWAMASILPAVAGGMARLYDNAVDAFMLAYGIEPQAPEARQLRQALYFTGTVIEGSSAIFWTRDRSGEAFRNTVRDIAVETLAGLLEKALEEARQPGTQVDREVPPGG
jgi:AcrR family transcriptional regulator